MHGRDRKSAIRAYKRKLLADAQKEPFMFGGRDDLGICRRINCQYPEKSNFEGIKREKVFICPNTNQKPVNLRKITCFTGMVSEKIYIYPLTRKEEP